MNLSIYIICIFLNFVICKSDIFLTINLQDPPQNIVDKKFFSIALDTSAVANHFKDFNMKNQRLTKLIKNLTPGYLRIGGNMADRLYFSNDSNSNSFKFNDIDDLSFTEVCAFEELENTCQDFPRDFPNFTMSGEEWIKLNNFAKKVGVKLLFDLNCLIRNEDGSWNSKNAKELISFSDSHNFDIDWQLGNEPNAFKHVFNYSVNASQLAHDFSVLRKILNTFPRYKKSLLVGPDITRPRPERPSSEIYLKKFLQNVYKESVLNAVSFHQYYLNGRTANISDFLNPSTFSLLENQINIVNNIVKTNGFNKTPIWLTETSSAFGGGAPGLSDTFVGSFLWLDKLGVSAKSGVKLIIRQSIKRDHYALIDDFYNPNPDWWLSVLFNLLVGPEALSYNNTASDTVRLYCHCAADISKISTITVFGINISNSTARIHLNGIKNSNYASFAYILTAENHNLLTKNVLLNGKVLELSKQADLPEFEKKNCGRRQAFNNASLFLSILDNTNFRSKILYATKYYIFLGY